MSQHWRSTLPESITSRFLRQRWPSDSLYVLDIDNLVCDVNGDRGLLIEWKSSGARDPKWSVTRKIARRLGWYAALFVYEEHDGEIVAIRATFQDLDGSLREPAALDFAEFDRWVFERFGSVAA